MGKSIQEISPGHQQGIIPAGGGIAFARSSAPSWAQVKFEGDVRQRRWLCALLKKFLTFLKKVDRC
jgi:hypothetical protein